MKFVIDIDGTICHSEGAYEDSSPFKDRIDWLNSKYDDGNYIVYFTARGMGASENDATVAYEKYYDLTANQLNLWGVKYHELFLGKPSGDIYIDDKAVNANSFFGVIDVINK